VFLGGSPVFTFASANVGTGITINTSGYAISGTDSGNYTLTQPTLSGDITAKELTITGITGSDKVYDDTTAATATGTFTLNGVESGDDVILGGSPVFTFASANVGTGITINTTGLTISGTDIGNYTLTQPTLSGDITAKELTITGITGSDKVYDDTTAATATGTFTLNGVESGDDVILGGSPVFTFASANVGTGITINTTGYTISMEPIQGTIHLRSQHFQETLLRRNSPLQESQEVIKYMMTPQRPVLQEQLHLLVLKQEMMCF
jgi:phosphotransferase system IIA component